ncbi:MAG: DEAD/DEAH box helicase [Desulfamplus sp.]|nr:DEAD/DEAH box helicase [Desulfamplus sp.]
MPFDSPLFKLPNTFRAFYGSFSALHPAQLETIDPIIEGRDIILQSATGSGKSEAVLAPCMERIIRSGRQISVLYIIPTRALAVDLRRRFEPVICDRLGLKVAIRTGDVKLAGGKRPDMMFTTPESLDVMLGSTNEEIRSFLCRVGCVIIDEIHPLIYNYRGVHLARLLARLERRNSRTMQRIAMSATIADVDALIDAFNFRPIPETCHIQSAVKRDVLARLVHLKNEPVEFPALLNDLHDTWEYSKILVFANSRGACDRLFGIINRTSRFKGVSELHYSNLKPFERKQAEKRFRKNSRALCIATSTLELGIDIGDVDAVLLYEPPDSVSAFLQRIGRANRREQTLNFWGVCQGEQASLQVVRFLAMLKLARQGVVESVPRRTLPSVMSQQIISCLYEKKQISLPAVTDLFSGTRKDFLERAVNFNRSGSSRTCFSESQMAAMLQSLEKKRWIKKTLVSGIYSGGFQYGKHLTEYKIWGNFPEAEQEYVLELIDAKESVFIANRHNLGQSGYLKAGRSAGKSTPLSGSAISPSVPPISPSSAPMPPSVTSSIPRPIADIPLSIVNQMEAGDKVHIAGRRLKIFRIDHDNLRVFAFPASAKPDKEILWIGMGCHVSFEVARMMRHILKGTDMASSAGSDEDTDSASSRGFADDPALLSRTRTLLEKELEKEKDVVVLANGIEVLKGRRTTYCYRTYIGSVGNLVLEWSIRNYLASSKEFYVSSNEIGVECSCLIKFENLNLPENRIAFESWVGENIKILRSIISLNLFCKTLPHDLLTTELTEFLFDKRVTDTFIHYLGHTSEVVSGDISSIQNPECRNHPDRSKSNHLDRPKSDYNGQNSLNEICLPHILEINPGISLLEQEKERWLHVKTHSYTIESSITLAATLTATMVSDYFIHDQCKKRFCFKLLRMATPDSFISKEDELFKEASKNQGLLHEKNVLNELKDKEELVIHMADSANISSTERFEDFLDTTRKLSVSGIAGITASDDTADTINADHIPKSRVYLSQCLLKLDCLEGFNIKALGVPDLLVVYFRDTGEKTEMVIETGDIKSSHVPRYHHKWQVAFYALILKKIIEINDIPARVSSKGFIITRPSQTFTTATCNKNSCDKSSKTSYDKSSKTSCGKSSKNLCNEKSENQFSGQSYEKYTFDIAPFMTAFPMLLGTFEHTISNILQSTQNFLSRCVDYRMQPHCTLCEWFSDCYTNALEKEDIQFIPGLTKGELLKLRKADVTTIERLHKTGIISLDSERRAFENHHQTKISPHKTARQKSMQALFSSGEQKKLTGKSDAIINNRIVLHKQRTRLFPSNICAHFFIHIIKDQISGLVAALGWLVMDDSFKIIESRVMIIERQQDHKSVWLEFTRTISESWYSKIMRGKGPHIFEFGSQTRHLLMDWAEFISGNPATCSDIDIVKSRQISSFLWQKQPSFWSDIKKIIGDHFYMPVPGSMSLFAIAEVFGCNQGVEPPSSLFHSYGKTSYINPSYGNLLYEQSSHGSLSHEQSSYGNLSQEQTSYRNMPHEELSIETISSQGSLKSRLESILKTMAELFKIVKPFLESQCIQEWKTESKSPFTNFIREERRLKEEDILVLQELTLNERMEKFRSLAYLEFKNTSINHEGKSLYLFNTTDKTMPSKFRKGDFLKLVTHEDEDELSPDSVIDIQNGHAVIIAEYDMEAGEISVLSRSGRLDPGKTSFYSLEEDIADFTGDKLTHAAEFIFSESSLTPVNQLLTGMWQYRQDMNSARWIQKWIETSVPGLNSSQLAALCLPFQYKTSMIQGPPGTGKTHLLAWILISLVMHAFEMGIPLKIGISALTHQAIDNVLNKVVFLVNKLLPENFSGQAFPASCIKWGKNTNGAAPDNATGEMPPQGKIRKKNRDMAVEFSTDADEVMSQTWAIIGATGFGFYNLFNSRNGEFPEALDWVVFDEASQVLLPQALLSLVYGKSNFLFLGDVCQLPPVVLGNYDEDLDHSILSKLVALYPQSHQVTLDTTYRMNREICDFPSRMWYQGKLCPDLSNADSRLQLNRAGLSCKSSDPNSSHMDSNKSDSIRQLIISALDPEKPVVMILADHEGSSQQCDMEAELMASLAHELMACCGLKPEQVALISPHRAQNNAIMKRLGEMIAESKTFSMPIVDTVERVQGAERDVIIFGITSSDPDHVLSEFLNSPNRLNVAMTRARHKLIIVGSRAFFSAIPDNEQMLDKNSCFKALLEHCKKKDSLFVMQQQYAI